MEGPRGVVRERAAVAIVAAARADALRSYREAASLYDAGISDLIEFAETEENAEVKRDVEAEIKRYQERADVMRAWLAVAPTDPVPAPTPAPTPRPAEKKNEIGIGIGNSNSIFSSEAEKKNGTGPGVFFGGRETPEPGPGTTEPRELRMGSMGSATQPQAQAQPHLEPAVAAAVESMIQEGVSVSWDDVVGLDSIKEQLRAAALLPRKLPKLAQRKKRPLSRFWLLSGPPGTGKTTLAQALAGEIARLTAGACCYMEATAAEIHQKWHGQSQKVVAHMFAEALRRAPTVLVLDEVDGVLAKRQDGEADHVRATKTQFLSGFDKIKRFPEKEVWIFLVTNNPWDLDVANLRRFSRAHVPLPTPELRLEYLRRFGPPDPEEVARQTHSFSNSDLRLLLDKSAERESALILKARAFVRCPDGFFRRWRPDRPLEGLEVLRVGVEELGPEAEVDDWPLAAEDLLETLRLGDVTASVPQADVARHEAWAANGRGAAAG